MTTRGRRSVPCPRDPDRALAMATAGGLKTVARNGTSAWAPGRIHSCSRKRAPSGPKGPYIALPAIADGGGSAAVEGTTSGARSMQQRGKPHHPECQQPLTVSPVPPRCFSQDANFANFVALQQGAIK